MMTLYIATTNGIPLPNTISSGASVSMMKAHFHGYKGDISWEFLDDAERKGRLLHDVAQAGFNQLMEMFTAEGFFPRYLTDLNTTVWNNPLEPWQKEVIDSLSAPHITYKFNPNRLSGISNVETQDPDERKES